MVKLLFFLVLIVLLWIPIWKFVNWMMKVGSDEINSEEERAENLKRDISQLSEDIEKKQAELKELLDNLERSKKEIKGDN